jgi:hypothetical protein
MSSEKHPYKIIQYRIDIVTKVPAWAEGTIQKGVEVIRLDAETVFVTEQGPGHGKYRLGESYTKFKRFGTPVELF